MQDRGEIRRIRPENAGWLASLLHAQLSPPPPPPPLNSCQSDHPGKRSSRARLIIIVNFKYTTLTRRVVAGLRSGLCFRRTVHGGPWSIPMVRGLDAPCWSMVRV